MRKLLTSLTGLLAAVILTLSLSACEMGSSSFAYELHTEDFGTVVPYKSEVNIENIKILQWAFSQSTEIVVTPDMVEGDYSTDTVGTKTITIAYGNEKITFSFDVKYQVEFKVGDKTVYSDMVLDIDELEIPDGQKFAEEGMKFVGWTPAVPEEITDNCVFVAEFEPDINPPALSGVTAEYGQTLAEIELPSNSQGKWVFTDDPATSVGNVGKREFGVKFETDIEGAEEIFSQVTVTVEKAKVEFVDLVMEFTYDGTEKFPTYTPSIDVFVMEMGERAVNVGTYDFTLLVNTANYDAMYIGKYSIVPAEATVTVPDYEMTYDDARTFAPTEYTVSGVDESLLGGVTLSKPFINGAGEYSVGVEIENKANIKLTVAGGKLTIIKSYLELSDPTLAEGVSPVFGDTLGDVALSEHGSGVWTWKNPELIIDTPTSFTATVVFTPNNSGYMSVERNITIPVDKKELPISVNSAAHVYDGTVKGVEYVVGDGSYTDVTVKVLYGGMESVYLANESGYTVTLEIVDARYKGSASTVMVINKAVPETDFASQRYEIIWTPDGRTLANISLPARYSWNDGNAKIGDDNIGTVLTYGAKYTPEDTDNYQVVEGEISVFMHKADAAVTAPASYSFLYNGNVQSLTGIIASHTEVGVRFTDRLGNDFDPSDIVKVGTYEIVAVLDETVHYKSASKDITVTIDVNEYPNKITPTVNAATYGDTLGSVLLPEDTLGTWSWVKATTTSVGDAGTRSFEAVFTPADDGYRSYVATVSVTVNKKVLNINVSENEFTYDGGEKQLAFTVTGYIDPAHSVTVSGNDAKVNFGRYTVNLTVNDQNYAGNASVTLIINKADYLPAIPTDLSAVYLDTLADVIIPDDENGTWSWNSALTTSVGNAGTASFKATFTHENSNYNTYETELEIAVAKKSVAVPTVASKVYTGYSIKADAMSNQLYSVTSNVGGTNVGAYDVVFTLANPANYAWDNGTDTATVTVDFNVTKAENTWTVQPSIKDSWTYGEAAPAPVGTAVFGSTIIKYVVNGAYQDTAPVNAGSYTVEISVADTANYAGLEPVELAITVKPRQVNIPVAGSKVYTGATLVSDISDEDMPYSIIKNDGGIDVTAEGYDVTLRLESANYVWYNGTSTVSGLEHTVKFYVKRATNTWTAAPTVNSPAYGQSVITSATAAFGTVTVSYKPQGSLDTEYTETVPTKAGKYVARFSIADNANYTAISGVYNFSITQADNLWAEEGTPALDITEWTYGKTAAEIINGGAAKFGNVSVTLDGRAFTAMPTEAGSYTLTFTVAETDDYKGISKSFTLTVNKDKVTPPDAISVVYNGAPQTSTFANAEGLWTAVNVTKTDVGSYDVELTLEDYANYEWTTDTASDTIKVKFNVTRATNSWTTAPALDKTEWTFSEVGAVINKYKALFGSVSVTLDGAAFTAIPTDAGSYTLTFTVAETDNYTGLEEEIDFTIARKAISVPTATYSTTYTGVLQYANAQRGTGYSVKKDAEGTDAGVYSVLYTLVSDNYVWDVEDEAERDTDKLVSCFTVNKAKVTVPTVSGKEYTGYPLTSGIVTNDYYTVSEADDQIEYGNYDVTLTLKNFKNYEWNSTELKDKETITLKFSISGSVNDWVTLPTLSKTEWYYGEAGATPNYGEAKYGNDTVSLKFIDSRDNEYAVMPTAAGTYKAVFTVAATDNYTDATHSVTFTIKQADNAWAEEGTPALDITEWTYGKTAAEIINGGAAKFGTVTVTLDGRAFTAMPTEAGSYTLTFTVSETDDYKGISKSFTLTVNKVKVTPPDAISVVYNGVPQTSTFADEAELWTAVNVTKTDVGSYDVELTLEDYANYEWTTDTASDTIKVKFNVTRATNSWTTAPALNKNTWSFGEAVAAINKYKALFGSVSVTLDGAEYTAMPTDVGSYTLTFTVAETDNYTGLEEEIDFTIVQAANGWTTAPALNKNAWSFGEVAAVINAYAAQFGSVSVTLDGEEYTAMPTDAGRYTLTFTVAETENYAGLTADVEFTINPAVVEVDTIADANIFADMAYNGSTQAPTPTEGTGFVLKTNAGGKDVGTYYVVFAPKNANYVLSTGEETYSVPFDIVKANPTISITMNGWIYSEYAEELAEAGVTNVADVDSLISINYYTAGGVLVSADSLGSLDNGTYKAVATLAATDNYNSATAEVSFTVSRKAVTLPVFANKSYTGSALYPTYDDSIYVVSFAEAPVNADTYEATVSLTDNYVWDESVTDYTVDFTVDKAQAIIYAAITPWSYGAYNEITNAHSYTSASSLFDCVTVEYLYTGVTNAGVEYESKTAPTEAGDYVLTVTVVGTDNCEGASDSIEFKVSKGQASVTVSILDWIYGNAASSPSYTGNIFDSAVTYKYVGTTNGNVAYDSETAPTEAGSYTVIATVADTDNCVGCTAVKDFTIKRLKVSIPTPIPVSKPYTGSDLYAGVTAPEGAKYRVTDASGTDVGTYKVTYLLIDTNNYAWNDGTEAGSLADVKVDCLTITQAQATVTAPTITGWQYLDTANAPASTSNLAKAAATIVYLYSDSVDGEYSETVPTLPGTYYVKATIATTDNYLGCESASTSFVLSKRSVYPPNLNLGSVNYTGSVVYPAYDSDAFNVSGGGTNAGNYTVTFTIKNTDLYQWVDATMVSSESTYTINPVAPTVSYTAYDTTPRYQYNLTYGGTAKGILGEALTGSFTISQAFAYGTTTDGSNKEFKYTVTFNPDSDNYTTVSKELVVYIKPAAYIGTSASSATYYGTIDLALAAAYNNGANDTIWAVIDGDVSDDVNYISSDMIIEAGDTFVVPFIAFNKTSVTVSGKKFADEQGSIFGDKIAHVNYTDLSKLEFVNQIVIKSGKTLTVNGTMMVMGQVSGSVGGYMAGHTAGKYTKVVMESGAKINIVGGTTYSYGFIYEDSYYNNSEVNVTSGGKLYQPFVINDFRAGTWLAGSYQHNPPIASFNQFELPNITSTVKVEQGSYLYGHGGLVAYSFNKYFVQEVCCIGAGGSGLLELTGSGGYVIAKYDVGNKGSAALVDPQQVTDGVCMLTINGDSKTNSMTLSVSGTTVNTAKVHFGLTWRFNITLASGTMTVAQKYKMLPGHVFTVAEGATLNLLEGSDLAIYAKFEDNATSYPTLNYKHGLAPAKLTVNGTLTSQGTVDGNIYSEVDGARIVLTSIGSTALEGVSDNGSATSPQITATLNCTSSAVVLYYGSNSITCHEQNEYISQNGTWILETVRIIFNSNGGNDTETVIASRTDGKYPALPTVTRTGYDFSGWYYGDTKVEAGDTLAAADSITLTAKWIQQYYISYDANGGDPVDGVYVSQSDGKYPTLPTPVFTGYDFVGWFYGDTQVAAGDTITAPVGTVTLTARWEKNGVIVSFDSVGGSSVANISVTDGVYPALTAPTLAGCRFDGWYYGNTLVEAGMSLLTTEDHTLTAKWTVYKVTFDANGGTCDLTEATGAVTLPTPTHATLKFNGWFDAAEGGNKVADGGASYAPTSDVTLYAQWVGYTITIAKQDQATVTVQGSAAAGEKVTIEVTFKNTGDSDTRLLNIKTADGKYLKLTNAETNVERQDVNTAGTYYFIMPASDIKVEAQSSSSGGNCVTPDTLITLADGTQVRVDQLKGDELLLVWNLETGMFDAAPIMFVDSEQVDVFEIIHLYFSDGTVVKVIYEHGFWDYDLNRYVYLDDNADDYIGHYFAKQNGDTLERVQLVDVVIEDVETSAWSPVTVGHLCYFVNGMLSMPGGVGGLFNIFEVDADTMSYDQEALMRDIETYGLYTYEELNEIEPLTEEMFNAAGGAYLKISIGKGNLTIEELQRMIRRYSEYFA